MTLVEALFSPEVLVALGFFLLGALLEPFLHNWLLRRFADNPPFRWFWERLFGPLLRAGLLLGFVLIAYPPLFGLNDAPSVGSLVADPHAKPSVALGVMFIVALCAPVLRLFNRHMEIVLPLQGLLATAFLFQWLTTYLHITVASAWPGSGPALMLLGLAYFGSLAASLIGRALGASLNTGFGLDDAEVLAMSATTMLAQVPLLLFYGAMLGRQLAI